MTMKKNEVLEIIKNGLELKTKKEANEVLDTVDAVIEVLANALEPSDKVNVGNYFYIQRKSIPTKEGMCAGKPYVVEAHDEIVIKRLGKMKKMLEVAE